MFQLGLYAHLLLLEVFQLNILDGQFLFDVVVLSSHGFDLFLEYLVFFGQFSHFGLGFLELLLVLGSNPLLLDFFELDALDS